MESWGGWGRRGLSQRVRVGEVRGVWGGREWSWVRWGLSRRVRVGEVRGVRGLGEFGLRVGLGLGNLEDCG